jgi:hypothetical protein
MSQGTPCYAQLDCVERLLAESQAREELLRKLLVDISYEVRQYAEGFTVLWDSVDEALETPLDGAALRQVKRETLIKAADKIDKCSFGDMAELVRKMAKDL